MSDHQRYAQVRSKRGRGKYTEWDLTPVDFWIAKLFDDEQVLKVTLSLIEGVTVQVRRADDI